MTNLTSRQQVEDAWRNYETTAFVHVPNPQAYSLRPNRGVVAGTENIYMLSAHHQLHCLRQLHLSFFDSRLHRERDTAQDRKHAEHCFDYLRQGIICAGDSTLEGPDLGKSSLSGNGVVHQCRAWDGSGGLESWRKSHAPLVG
ncbi:hypothetical protein C8A01DRAFT_51454 [Parachaetomium inaequale]|uniref:Uncharacterized protein n=1 Tax=Parachaetomium inaequale TaxID=2588326 RepID=A0AAN6P4A0_9PEZI|nr:hypothetical protein C8A01DRAFT_51454 [Parachaetomium inaequale]